MAIHRTASFLVLSTCIHTTSLHARLGANSANSDNGRCRWSVQRRHPLHAPFQRGGRGKELGCSSQGRSKACTGFGHFFELAPRAVDAEYEGEDESRWSHYCYPDATELVILAPHSTHGIKYRCKCTNASRRGESWY